MTGKKSIFWWVCVAAVLAAALLVYFFLFSNASGRTIVTEKALTVGRASIEVAVVDTPQERERGLSGTTELSEGEGMLFVFEKDDQYSFWMKDMHYPIDIIWISAAKRVVYIEKEVSPDTFPQSFTPPTRARYVLEVPAGFAARHGIEVGSVADF